MMALRTRSDATLGPDELLLDVGVAGLGVLGDAVRGCSARVCTACDRVLAAAGGAGQEADLVLVAAVCACTCGSRLPITPCDRVGHLRLRRRAAQRDVDLVAAAEVQARAGSPRR